MKAIKEKISGKLITSDVFDKGLTTKFYQKYNEGIEDCLEIIRETEQDYTFIKVPKKMKFSELKQRIEETLKKTAFDFEDSNMFFSNDKYNKRLVYRSWSSNDIEIYFTEDMKITIVNVGTKDMPYFKWLYELWFTETEIEVEE